MRQVKEPQRIAISGGRGFLGFHVRAALEEAGVDVRLIPLGEKFDRDQAASDISRADSVLHLAGVNRGTDSEVEEGNLLFARQVDEALRRADKKPRRLVFANSIQASMDTPYGQSKRSAGDMLAKSAAGVGADFDDVLLPNLFGEFGRPFYNSVVATFSHLIAQGGTPEVHQDRELTLLHAQNAADLLTGSVPLDQLDSLTHRLTVTEVLRLLNNMSAAYANGEFPDLSSDLKRDMFNTYRSFTFPDATPLGITRHADARGSFFEIVRSHGGTGQTSFSTTEPGITRGDHFHRRKVERFTVLSGTAEIRLRKLYDSQVYSYTISGDEPFSVDMPTMYSHNIQNVGDSTLYTAFWTNDIFDPENPDTIPEAV